MTCHLTALCFDGHDPRRLARFWAGLVGWDVVSDPKDGVALLPADDTGFRMRYCQLGSRSPARTGCTST
jgi:Glyoxalase-like domain